MEEELTIEDFGTDELIEEIKRRTVDDPLKEIRAILGLKKWHDKDRIIQEIQNF